MFLDNIVNEESSKDINMNLFESVYNNFLEVNIESEISWNNLMEDVYKDRVHNFYNEDSDNDYDDEDNGKSNNNRETLNKVLGWIKDRIKSLGTAIMNGLNYVKIKFVDVSKVINKKVDSRMIAANGPINMKVKTWITLFMKTNNYDSIMRDILKIANDLIVKQQKFEKDKARRSDFREMKEYIKYDLKHFQSNFIVKLLADENDKSMNLSIDFDVDPVWCLDGILEFKDCIVRILSEQKKHHVGFLDDKYKVLKYHNELHNRNLKMVKKIDGLLSKIYSTGLKQYYELSSFSLRVILIAYKNAKMKEQ